jgi:hypothetical protein
MIIDNYKYLAMQNKIASGTANDPTNLNITYNINTYSIPKNKQIMKVVYFNKNFFKITQVLTQIVSKNYPSRKCIQLKIEV